MAYYPYIYPNTIDVRSLALFRILLGLYLLYDVYSRVSLGKYDLAWYTSEPSFRSYLDPLDSPHKAPLHKIWFYRGNLQTQVLCFLATAILSLCFCVGFVCNGTLKVTLWLFVTAMQNRNMHVHDASDQFVRHLLFWSCFLPLSDIWSIDARRHKNKPKAASMQVTGLACLALTLQVALMYWGTVFHRTLDLYSWRDLSQSEWLPPQLSAVYYAVAGSFASRRNNLTLLLRSSKALGNALTLISTIVEVFAPLGCLLAGNRRHWFGILLFQMHAGMLLVFNLPNWQFVGMLTEVIWIPTVVWDSWLHQDSVTSSYKKTDGDPIRKARNNPISRILQLFFFSYMLYNWCGNRGWVAKHDSGDIGEGVRLSQFWVMYSTLSHWKYTTQLTGILTDGRRIDLWHFLKKAEEKDQANDDSMPHDMSDRYPSPRWERAIYQWSNAGDRKRGTILCTALCVLVNEDRLERKIRQIELRYQRTQIMPVGGGDKSYFDEDRVNRLGRMPDDIITVKCGEALVGE